MAGIQPKKHSLRLQNIYNLIQGSFASYAAINSQNAPKPLTKLYSHFRLDTKRVVCRQRSSLIQLSGRFRFHGEQSETSKLPPEKN